MIWNCCQNNCVVPGRDKRVLKGFFLEKFEDTKDIIIRTDNVIAKKKMAERQTMIYKTLHRKLMMPQHEPH